MKQKPPFTLVYEDDFITVVDKAPGIGVGADRWDDTRERLDRILAAYYAEKAADPTIPPPRLFTVHRIDRETSGLVVFARDGETHKRLSAAFETRQVTKQYLAVVHGRPSWTETSCELSLVPNGDKRHRTIIDQYRGKKSQTRFRLLLSAGNYSLVEALPATGRTHQIRVHLASLGHPVVNDPLYGSLKPVFLSSFKRGWQGDPLEEKPLLARLGLHAAQLILPPYRSDQANSLLLEAPPPRDLAALIRQMEKNGDRKSVE
ncbi:RluA family pseudouridine synthase [Treponema sp. TIM-1]|uniref:RluA family pseudouridine synthase n=1 Tax=Treponema sp. TIM-1 TaxID=2898417 RepID=UPI0039818AEC